VNEHNALLAGVPRSGTTLTCELLNLVPDTVALDEPMKARVLTGQGPPGSEPAGGTDGGAPDPSAISDQIERFLADTRESIATRGTAISQQVEGRVMGGKYADDYGDDGPRTALASKGEIRVDKELSEHFLLAIKHTGAFTALLEALVERFPVYAVVRNPVAILSSWQTVPFPGRDGHHPLAERIDPGLARALQGIDDRLDRQVHLLGWFFEQYHRLLDDGRVLRYEQIVESGGRALAAVTERAAALDEPLRNRNSGVYERPAMEEIARRLLSHEEGAWWHFYPRESVSALVEQ
jgi:hypothetical protein